MIPVGRKGRDFFKRREMTFSEEYVGLTGAGSVKHEDAVEIANRIIRTFTEDETIDKVFLVFTEFKTVLSQKPVVEQLLPIPRIENAEARREFGASRIYLRAAAGGNFRTFAAETSRNADLSRDARIGRFRTRFANDGDGFGVEKRGRID
jgi:F0F1-type ATP synthase gamma subunit